HGLSAVRSQQHRVAETFEHVARQSAQGRFVFGDEDRLRAAGERRGRGRLLDFRSALVHGQIDAEGRAVPRFAIDVDVPVVLFDDAVGHGEAEARAFAQLFGREERLEDARLRLGVHACAGVAHFDLDVATGLDVAGAATI